MARQDEDDGYAVDVDVSNVLAAFNIPVDFHYDLLEEITPLIRNMSHGDRERMDKRNPAPAEEVSIILEKYGLYNPSAQAQCVAELVPFIQIQKDNLNHRRLSMEGFLFGERYHLIYLFEPNGRGKPLTPSPPQYSHRFSLTIVQLNSFQGANV